MFGLGFFFEEEQNSLNNFTSQSHLTGRGALFKIGSTRIFSLFIFVSLLM